MDERTIARFWAKVQRGEPDACWPWQAFSHKGYGRFTMGSRTDGTHRNERAHRVAFRIANGRWADPCVMHKCDNPSCCNPAHLAEATHQENMADREAKGRNVIVSGARHGRSKLNPRNQNNG